MRIARATPNFDWSEFTTKLFVGLDPLFSRPLNADPTNGYCRGLTALLYNAGVISNRLHCTRTIAYPAYWTLAVMLVAGMTVASCDSPSAHSGTEATIRRGGGPASATKACDLLTVEEIKLATGAVMVAEPLQTTDTQASCDWHSADETSGAAGVGVIVSDFDASLWQSMSSAQRATPVTGVGEQAYKGVPHSGDLTVKQGKYAVSVGIVDFKHNNAIVDAAALQLMNLVLSRL